MMKTVRLDLIPATAAHLRADLAGHEALAAALGVTVPEGWPPEFLDEPSVQYTLHQLELGSAHADWWTHYIVLRDEQVLVGVVGYKGPPRQGIVEVGYSVMPSYRRRGIATEAAQALVARAFEHPEVTQVVAETLPELTPSIGVLEKLGFTFAGEGSEPGVLRYQLVRPRSR